jgi:predicted DNA-binding transcriptional regulator AlpA
LTPLDELPNWAVISNAQAVKLLGFSRDTLARLDKSGDGPPKVILSPRRHGRPIGELRAWLAKRRASHRE